ncbi:hypothetical protein H6B12_06575, partial [Flavonifractor plautii]|nr:hypothetical protein [Flavonifractor plautii]
MTGSASFTAGAAFLTGSASFAAGAAFLTGSASFAAGAVFFFAAAVFSGAGADSFAVGAGLTAAGISFSTGFFSAAAFFTFAESDFSRAILILPFTYDPNDKTPAASEICGLNAGAKFADAKNITHLRSFLQSFLAYLYGKSIILLKHDKFNCAGPVSLLHRAEMNTSTSEAGGCHYAGIALCSSQTRATRN